MNTNTPTALTVALDHLSARPYRSNYNHAADMAADCLAGRSHYLDAGNMAFFKSRVLSASLPANGLGLAIITSDRPDDAAPRHFRAVVFDVFGVVVFRPDPLTTRAKAEKTLAEYLAEWDATAHTIAAARQTARQRANAALDARDALASLTA